MKLTTKLHPSHEHRVFFKILSKPFPVILPHIWNTFLDELVKIKIISGKEIQTGYLALNHIRFCESAKGDRVEVNVVRIHEILETNPKVNKILILGLSYNI